MRNVMTVDLEDWYHGNDFDFDLSAGHNFQDRVEHGTNILLEMLARHRVRATFFVLGCVAGEHPELVRRIAELGHEVGSHGFRHRMLTRQTEAGFRRDLLLGRDILQEITGKPVVLYRAPSWSICARTLWALRILEEEGFVCDSSIQSFWHPLAGFPGAPVVPFHPVVEGQRLGLVEFPATVLPWGRLRVPFAGGLYLRVLPLSFLLRAFRSVSKRRPAMLYTHPWELDTGQPRLKVSPTAKMAHYCNLHTTQGKLNAILQDLPFGPLGEVVENGEFPSLRVGKRHLW